MSYSNYMTARPWERPIGVSILSVLHLIGAALLAISAIMLIIASGKNPQIAEVWARVGYSPLMVLAALGILGLLLLASGIGMWNGERWGWYLGSFYYVYFIVRNVTALFEIEHFFAAFTPEEIAEAHMSIGFFYFKHSVRAVLSVLLYLYFFKGNVRAYFKIREWSILPTILVQVGICIAFDFVFILFIR